MYFRKVFPKIQENQLLHAQPLRDSPNPAVQNSLPSITPALRQLPGIKIEYKRSKSTSAEAGGSRLGPKNTGTSSANSRRAYPRREKRSGALQKEAAER